MLVALLSSRELTTGEPSLPRAFLRVGGQTILSRQVEFALSMGCERIICLSYDLTPEIVEIQHTVEKSGAVFHAMQTAMNLSGMISIADDLLVLADGLVFESVLGLQHMGPHRAVLTIAAEPAVSVGFERLDQTRAWAGVMVIAGALVEQLAELPSDVDPHSSLLRLALQSGTSCVQLPDTALSSGHWALAHSPQIAASYEREWLDRHAHIAPITAPFSTLADRAAVVTIRKHPRAKMAALVGSWGALPLLGAGALLGYAGYPTFGLGASFLAAFSMRFGGSLTKVLNPSESNQRTKLSSGLQLVLDLALIFLCVVATPAHDQIEMAFASATMIGLLRLVTMGDRSNWWQKWQAFASDRGTLVIALVFLSLTSGFLLSIQLIALVLLATVLLKNYRAELT